ncbi:HNH endonuclease signature motif containing protein [Streptomyces sp. NPDC050738]|uniref:HNH endonuclease signature motif containing protein n=1 Tax=Streptomyces sp. NPDC050738 TaxID=3154744 RepID=UPI003423C34D
MAISSAARKVLWARSSDICAFPGCAQQLTVNLQSEESKTLEAAGIPLGEEAHIASGSKDGPRYDSSYPAEKVDGYENLILLCPTHHRLIDKRDGSGFSTETLLKMKTDHESAQKSHKTLTERRLEEVELRTIAMIEGWALRSGLDGWQNLTWKLSAPVPRLKIDEIDGLTEQAEWTLTRSWPPQYPGICRAFNNYGMVLRDTVNHIRTSMEPIEGRSDIWEMYREYKYRAMTQEEYDASLADFHFRVDVLSELSLELTKAANFVCEATRSEIDPLFRFEEGVLPHRVGDGVFVNDFTREEYAPSDLERPTPYLGNSALVARVKEQGGASR